MSGTAQAQCPGDLTGSGDVNVFDLLALLTCWGLVVEGCESADLDGDGTVNVFDLLGLLVSWGPCACVPDCDGSVCGDDGCGGSCGSCPDGQPCVDGQCACVPNCAGTTCGDDGCGGSCGTCGSGTICQNGTCVVAEGQCCWPGSTSCMVVPHASCLASVGAYMGHGTDCSTPCPFQTSTSCYGKCGNHAGGCWCDFWCAGNNDCCEDVCFYCGHLPDYGWCN